MQLKLPQADFKFPCFKKDSEVYLVIEKTLYSFTPLKVKPIKTLPEYISCPRVTTAEGLSITTNVVVV
jgi:hypothetical protein